MHACHTCCAVTELKIYAKLYASLNAQQRACLLSKSGLNLNELSQKQISDFLKLPVFDLIESKTDDIKIYASRQSKGKTFEYNFKALDANGHFGPVTWEFTTPEYKGKTEKAY